MRVWTIAAACGALALAGAAKGQETELTRPRIIVQGQGVAERPAERFSLNLALVGRGPDQISALRDLAARRQRVLDGLLGLEGVAEAAVGVEAASVEGIPDSTCEAAPRFSNACAPSLFVATVRIAYRASPADRAGDAVSLAGELGATDVRLGQFDVVDSEALVSEATAAAVADARRQATTIAAASGYRLGRLVRVQDANTRDLGFIDIDQVADVGIFGSNAARPEIRLDLPAPPVERRMRVAAEFEVE